MRNQLWFRIFIIMPREKETIRNFSLPSHKSATGRTRPILLVYCIFFIIAFHFFSCASNRTPDDEKIALEILFTANINGNIENCNCGNPPLGGLDYLATLIKTEREKPYPVWYIEGGDYFNSYPYPRLDQAATDILDILRPDGFLPGEQELNEQETLLASLHDDKRILYSNLAHAKFGEGEVFRRSLKGDKQVIVAGYLSPQSFANGPPAKIIFSEKRFIDLYSAKRPGTLLIVVFHGPKAALDRFIQKYPQTDVILWGHEQSKMTDTEGKPAVIGGASDGEYLVTIQFVPSFAEAWTIHVKHIPVGKTVAPDKQVQKIIEDFNNSVRDSKQ